MDRLKPVLLWGNARRDLEQAPARREGGSEGHAGYWNTRQGSDPAPDGGLLQSEGRGGQVELHHQLDVPAVPALVPRHTPAVGLEAGLGCAVRVDRAEEAGKPCTVGVAWALRAHFGGLREITEKTGVAEALPPLGRACSSCVTVTGTACAYGGLHLGGVGSRIAGSTGPVGYRP